MGEKLENKENTNLPPTTSSHFNAIREGHRARSAPPQKRRELRDGGGMKGTTLNKRPRYHKKAGINCGGKNQMDGRSD